MSARRVLAAVAAVVLVFAVFVGGVVVGGHAQATGLVNLNNPLRGWLLGGSGQDLSGQVLDLLRERYYQKVDTTGLERASVDAIIAKLGDPYTDYFDPDELKALRDQTDRAYYGVGMVVAQRDEDVVVVTVYDGSPAQKAGVRPGDVLVSVDGKPTAGRALDSVVADVRGAAGTDVTLGVRTGDAATRELTMTRKRLQAPAVASRIVTSGGHKVGYVQLVQFSPGAADELRKQVEDLRAKGATSLVLDLRGDPGGLVKEAIGVAGVFLPRNSTVVITHGEHAERHVYATGTSPVAGKLPLYVLVDRNSASASEIVAGALRDAKRGTLVGERTFGKALVQTTIPLRDGGALKLTTMRYLTPSGYDLAKRGLPPAIKAVDDPATPKRDEARQKAIALAAAAG